MNLDRYEKIDGREALKRLLDGERIYLDCGCSYELGKANYPSVKRFRDERDTGIYDWDSQQPLTLNDLCGQDWYIPKPFDVRQAMLDRPNEWVGAYKNFEGKWFKVGFDTASMNAVVEQIEWDGNPFWQHGRARPSVLNECIPIEDVPEEAR